MKKFKKIWKIIDWSLTREMRWIVSLGRFLWVLILWAFIEKWEIHWTTFSPFLSQINFKKRFFLEDKLQNKDKCRISRIWTQNLNQTTQQIALTSTHQSIPKKILKKCCVFCKKKPNCKWKIDSNKCDFLEIWSNKKPRKS